jgi:small subunit ribosomal protein S12
MARLTQLIKKSVSRIKNKTSNISNNPQRRVICIKVLTISPKKPNSANRRVCKVKLIKTKQLLTVKIPGEGHNVQQHSTILIRGGRSRDLIGVRNIAIRGKYDLSGVSSRKTSRSRYGVKRLVIKG